MSYLTIAYMGYKGYNEYKSNEDEQDKRDEQHNQAMQTGRMQQDLVKYPSLSGKSLYEWAQDYGSKYDYDPAKPYPGQLSAPMTGVEQTAQKQLGQFQNQQTPEVLGQSAKYTSDVLGGKYDPRSSPYYASMKSQILQDQEEAQAKILHGSAQKGMLHSDPRREEEANLSRKTSGDLASLLGSLYENERGRMGEAASQAVTTAEAQQNLPLQQIMAGAEYGKIPREVEQAGLGRELGEYLRQLAGAREPLNIYETLFKAGASPKITIGEPTQSKKEDNSSSWSGIFSLLNNNNSNSGGGGSVSGGGNTMFL